mgnify:CR=1 FL=1
MITILRIEKTERNVDIILSDDGVFQGGISGVRRTIRLSAQQFEYLLAGHAMPVNVEIGPW